MKLNQIISQNEIRKIVREELNRINNEQLLKEQMNEQIGSIISGILGNASSGFIDSAKNAICNALISRFGVSREDFFGSVICNTFEEMELNEWWSLITGDRNRCQLIAQNLLDAVAESLLERLTREVFNIDRNSWLYTALVNPLIESIQNSIVRNAGLTQRVAQGICEIDIMNIFQSAGADENEASRLVSAARGGSAAPAAPAAS